MSSRSPVWWDPAPAGSWKAPVGVSILSQLWAPGTAHLVLTTPSDESPLGLTHASLGHGPAALGDPRPVALMPVGHPKGEGADPATGQVWGRGDDAGPVEHSRPAMPSPPPPPKVRSVGAVSVPVVESVSSVVHQCLLSWGSPPQGNRPWY